MVKGEVGGRVRESFSATGVKSCSKDVSAVGNEIVLHLSTSPFSDLRFVTVERIGKGLDGSLVFFF